MNWKLFLSLFIDALLEVKTQLALLLSLIIALMGVYILLEAPKYKTSWVMLLPGTERSSTISLDNLGETRSSGANAYGSVSISPKNTYKEIALSDAVINKAAAEYGVEANSFSKPRIKLIDQTPAMQSTLIGESKEEPLYRANLFNQTFHNTLDRLRKNEIERNFNGIKANLNDVTTRLAQARREVVAHQIKGDFVSEQQFQRWMSDAESLRVQKTTSDVDKAQTAATIEASLAQLSITAEQSKSLTSLLSNPALKSMLTSLGEKVAEQASLKAQFAAQNPLRKNLDREVSALTKQLRDVLTTVPGIGDMPNTKLFGLASERATTAVQGVNDLLARLAGLEAQNQVLKKSRGEYQARIKSHTQSAATLADLQRDHQIAEAIFRSSLAKLDTSRLDIYATYPLTQLLTQPGATIERDRLKTKLVILASILIVGMLSRSFILARMRKKILCEDEHSLNGIATNSVAPT
ncbi:MAG: hypothetical protein ACI9FR_000456 [Cryomorphaceae bacterium]|jgi:uncharacterized protein involved in exopolysaccharide biosynthesis